MSISGSMYAGISGLTVHSQAMSVIGNNLANSSTIGYKSATTQFEDVFYSTVSTSNGLSQVGHGATVASIYQSFSQGSYESSTSDTAVAIGGNGFFMVNNPNTGERYYTRAGNFQFDQYGYLVDAHGYRVQGWDAASTKANGVVQTQGALSSLQLTSYQSPPSATSSVFLSVNLNKAAEDKNNDAADPFFSVFNDWDGQAESPMGDSQYSYQTTMTVYDEAGTAHELTVYFDKVSDDAVASQAGGSQVWEYVVTCDPADDGRIIDGQKLNTTSAAGLLMTGTLTFNSSGIMQGMTAFTLGSTATGDLHDLANWTPAEFSEDGYPVFTANFSGSPNASTPDATAAHNIELNLGLRNEGTGWAAGMVSNAAAIGNNFSAIGTFDSPELIAGASTAYASASSTYDQSQDGYATGYLQGIEVSRDGVISGQYSNGQIVDLFVLGLADFNNPQGLILQGGTLYTEGSDSGSARIGRANSSSYGTIASNTLEQSNVDMSTEMVRLITTQRGYSANAKIITTADSMLQEAISLKR